jgi:hypothetical protein
MPSDLVSETINMATRLAVISQQTEIQNDNTCTPADYFHTKQLAAHPKLKRCIYTYLSSKPNDYS